MKSFCFFIDNCFFFLFIANFILVYYFWSFLVLGWYVLKKFYWSWWILLFIYFNIDPRINLLQFEFEWSPLYWLMIFEIWYVLWPMYALGWITFYMWWFVWNVNIIEVDFPALYFALWFDFGTRCTFFFHNTVSIVWLKTQWFFIDFYAVIWIWLDACLT